MIANKGAITITDTTEDVYEVHYYKKESLEKVRFSHEKLKTVKAKARQYINQNESYLIIIYKQGTELSSLKRNLKNDSWSTWKDSIHGKEMKYDSSKILQARTLY